MLNEAVLSASPAFFLGANTPEGFTSLFSELYAPEEGWRLFILTGGPGTGKSSVLKRIAAEADRRGLFCERIHCSSDPKSLDAVIIPRLRVSAADGTLPHAISPRFPGVSEKLVDLGAFRNDGLLRENGDKIIEKTLENSLEHKKCVGFLRAAATAAADNRAVTGAGTDMLKLKKFAVSFSENLIKTEGSQSGGVSRRFLSAVTPEGETVFYDSFNGLCEKKIVLDDDYGVCAPLILKVLGERALNAGLSVIECPCCMRAGRASEHLIIPELSLGVFTSNKYHSYEGEQVKTVRCMRFCRPSVFREHRNRISFNARAQEEFIAEAVKKMKNAKRAHDELEQYYIGAMNFDGVREKSEEIIREIF